MNIKQSLQISKSKIMPYFDYGDILYHSTSGSLTEKLQRLQNRDLTISLRLPRLTPTASVHKQANVNYLEDRRTSHLLKRKAHPISMLPFIVYTCSTKGLLKCIMLKGVAYAILKEYLSV